MISAMGKIEAITRAVEKLTRAERARLRVWFDEYESRLFDDQIERDAKAGKLDKLLDEVRKRHQAGPREEL